MNEQDIFNSPTQEAARLAAALGEVREVLREMQRQIAALEARAKRAFPTAFPKAASRAAEPVETEGSSSKLTLEQLFSLYDQVVEIARSHGSDAASARLHEIELGDLNLLRKELGISLGTRKPSKAVLVKTILGRVNESVLLTKHTNRQELLNRAQYKG